MKVLPKEFAGRGEVNGVFFEQVKRTNREYPDLKKKYDGYNIAMYKRSDGHYECVNIMYHGGYTIKGNVIEAGEYYGKGESWTGYCVRDLQKATEIYEGMVKCLSGVVADLDD